MPGNRERFLDEPKSVCVQHVGMNVIQNIRKKTAAAFQCPHSIDIDEVVIDIVARQAFCMGCGLQHRNADAGARRQLRDVLKRWPAFQQRLDVEPIGRGQEIELRHVHVCATYKPETCGMRRRTIRLARSSSQGRSYLRKQ